MAVVGPRVIPVRTSVGDVVPCVVIVELSVIAVGRLVVPVELLWFLLGILWLLWRPYGVIVARI